MKPNSGCHAGSRDRRAFILIEPTRQRQGLLRGLESMQKIILAIFLCGTFVASASLLTDTQTPRSVGVIFLDAIRSGDLEKVKLLLENNPALVSSKDTNGMTPLHFAALEGHYDIAEFL